MDLNEKPAFDFTRQDWEYIAMVSIVLSCTFGHMQILALIYKKDESVKGVGQMLFPMGNLLNFEPKKQFKFIEDALCHIKYLALDFPNTKLIGESVIYNTTKNGKDLLDLLQNIPGFEVSNPKI